jgi:taurine dioxygenase
MKIEPSGQACGAQVRGVDLSQALDSEQIRAIREAWLQHHVLAFPDQELSDNDLERLARYFGQFGREPYFVPIEGSEHVVALTRRADETAPIFAESWHSDWSFEARPPIGTCLYSLVIPPVGGETGFINQQLALQAMPAELRQKLEGKLALHSAAAAYAPDGLYGEAEADSDRSMKILYSEDARDVQLHPLIQPHPESGRDGIYGCLGYIIGIEGMSDEQAGELLFELYAWQTREEFQYTHRWQEGMFVMWDNRSVLHKANGGYDGYDRELHRITVAPDEALYLNVA